MNHPYIIGCKRAFDPKAEFLKNSKDEFYTLYEDVEKELNHFADFFKDKIIYLNCDNWKESQFYKYFFKNFKELGLMSLITTHYIPEGRRIDPDGEPNFNCSVLNATGNPNVPMIGQKRYLEGDGDFRSEECIEFLKLADIVITNPPFTLAQEHLELLRKYNKKFIRIGTMDAIMLKYMFQMFSNKEVFLGCTGPRLNFLRPNGKIENIASGWYNNLADRRYACKNIDNMDCFLQDYQMYDNYDAIEVPRIKDIPGDYEGEMGVPCTFLWYLNPKQYKIIGTSRSVKTRKIPGQSKGQFVLNGKAKAPRLVIKLQPDWDYEVPF